MSNDEAVCAQCGVANPAMARFCMSCGAPLAGVCPSCGTPAVPGARFCMSCGHAFAAGDGPPPEPPAPTVSEERRTVTVLFADLSGYTAVAERLDHETVKGMVEGCLLRFATEVERFGGRVDKFIGDNVMAVFGAPQAHEDDPERAVRAALGMQTAMAELNAAMLADIGVELSLRVGVNTGEVLAGRVGEDYTVLGDAVNVAARLQAAAPVGGILVGERTRRLSEPAIVYREREPLDVKGKANPVAVWEALASSEPGHRSERREHRTPLIGRDEELGRLHTMLERVLRDGTPHLMTVIGEAGVGKTRLLYEFERSLIASQPDTRLRRGRCAAFGASSIYWPLLEVLRSECAILDDDDPAQALAKLRERLAPLIAAREGPDQVERRLSPLARLLGAEAGDAAGEPEDQRSAREAFFGSVRAVLEALADEGPLVLVWEDIHWADEGTLDLIEYLSSWLRAPILQVCLAREDLLERRPSWTTARRTVSLVFLEPLASDDSCTLIEALLRAAGAQTGLESALAERSGGNPLFAEEMVQRIAEDGEAAAVELPDTVQGLLAARLDALEPVERQLVEHAAVVGQTLWESALEPVAAAAGADLGSALVSLREKDILVPGEGAALAGERELAFKHVLIRDVAYEMLPKALRARRHAEVAAFLEERAGGRGEGIAALLSEHYGRAARLAVDVRLPPEEVHALRDKALAFTESAGDAAAALFSNVEALTHYETALAFADADDEEAVARIWEKRGDLLLRLGRVEPAIEAWQRCLRHRTERQELEHVAELHRKIGAALAHKGERKEAIEHHQQGINLIKDLPPSLELVRLYEEAAWLYVQVGANMLAIYASEKALRLAEALGEDRAASRAHGIFGRVFARMGDKVKARENLERAVELARGSGEGETIIALLALGNSLELSDGDYAGAQERYLEALEIAQRIGDVPAQIELQAALGELAVNRCDWDEVVRASDASAELAESEGLVAKLCLANNLRGLLRWRDGDLEASGVLFALACERAEQLGWSEVAVSALLGLAASLRDRGSPQETFAPLEQALAICEHAGLIAQSIQAHAALAQARMLAGDEKAAVEAAEMAVADAERIRYPVGEAAALEARATVAPVDEAEEAIGEARAAWERLGRRLDVARCELLLARRLQGHDEAAMTAALDRAAGAYEQLGVAHLAAQARELAVASGS